MSVLRPYLYKAIGKPQSMSQWHDWTGPPNAVPS